MKKQKLFQQILMERKQPVKRKISTLILIGVRIYCYLIKYQTKQKHLLPFHDTNNELRKVLY